VGFIGLKFTHKPEESLLFLGRLARKNTFSSFSFPFAELRGFLCGGDHCWMSSFGVFSVSRPTLQADRFFPLVLRGLHKDPSKFSLSLSYIKSKKTLSNTTIFCCLNYIYRGIPAESNENIPQASIVKIVVNWIYVICKIYKTSMHNPSLHNM